MFFNELDNHPNRPARAGQVGDAAWLAIAEFYGSKAGPADPFDHVPSY